MRKWEATKVMKRALHALALYRYHIMTHLAIGIVMLWLLWTCTLRYRAFGTSVDMAIYTQFCWLLSRGEVMTEATFNRSIGGPQHPSNPLADHMALVLLPISVVYKLFPSPVTLITIQVLAVWFSVLGLWRLSQVRLRDSLIASLLSIGFALYPPMYFQARNDFHTDVFTMLAIIWLWVGIVEDKRWLFWSCLIGALSARESAAVPLLVLGMMLLLRRDERRFGAIILMASGIWFVLCNGLLLPWLRAGRPHVAIIWAYGYLGESLGKILISAVMNPSQVARYLISTDTWLTAIQLLAPMLFLPLLCPRFAIPAFTVFGMVFASRFAPMRNVAYQGLIPCAGLLLLGCIEAFVAIESAFDGLMRKCVMRMTIRHLRFGLATAILGSIIVCWQLILPLPLYLNPDHPIRDPERLRALRAGVQAIPIDAPVVVSAHLAAHVANRRWVWLFKGATPLPKPYSTLGIEHLPKDLHQPIYILVQLNVPDAEQPITPSELNQLKRLRGIEVLMENEYVVLMKYHHHLDCRASM